MAKTEIRSVKESRPGDLCISEKMCGSKACRENAELRGATPVADILAQDGPEVVVFCESFDTNGHGSKKRGGF